MSTPDNTLKAADFVMQALELEAERAAIAERVRELKRDANAGIFTVQLETSEGPAAFLVYLYDLDVTDDQGRTGRTLFDSDVQTLETAAERDAPGPRIVAHATSDANGFILAATPATYRLLTGEAVTAPVEAAAGDLLPTAETAEIRRKAASDMLRHLRGGNAAASQWLTAMQAEGKAQPGTGSDETLPFNSEETELALFLLDERSIEHLLQAISLVLTAARQHAAEALGEAGADEPHEAPSR